MRYIIAHFLDFGVLNVKTHQKINKPLRNHGNFNQQKLCIRTALSPVPITIGGNLNKPKSEGFITGSTALFWRTALYIRRHQKPL